MRQDLEWSYRTPPVQPLWRRLWEGFEPIGEMIVLVAGVSGLFWLMLMVASL